LPPRASCPRPLRALIKELWHTEPGERPAFLNVRHRLAEMLRDATQG
jgi:hypothetical protein